MGNITYKKSGKRVKYGDCEETFDINGDTKINVTRTIDPATFYHLYIKLNNVIGVRMVSNKAVETVLAPAPIELLVHLMMKDDNFTVVFRNKDASLIKLGQELGKSPSSIYATLSRLRKTGYIITDEDNIFTLNKELQDLVNMTRQYMKSGKPLVFNYLFEFYVDDKEKK
jgi:biotin operon repressor